MIRHRMSDKWQGEQRPMCGQGAQEELGAKPQELSFTAQSWARSLKSTKKRGDDRHVHGDGALLGDWPQLWAVHESPCGLTDTLVDHNIKWIQEAAEDSEEDVEYQELPDTVRRGFPNETRKVKDAVKSYLGVWEHSSFVPFFRLNCQEGKLAFESKFGLESDYPLILSLI